ncbi:MAG: TolC family protein [Gemmatimonadaceae bacterium]
MPYIRAFSLAALLATAAPGRAQIPIDGAKPPREVTLAQAIRSADVSHPLVLAAQARVAAARGSRASARVWTNPMLTHQVENAPFPGTNAIGLEREAMTFAMVPLEPLYQRWPRVHGANAELKVAEATLAAVRLEVQLDVARAFYRVAMAQVSVSSAEDARQWLDSLVAYTRSRVSEGVAAESDLLRLEVELGRALIAETIARAELARATGELRSHIAPSTSPDSVDIDFADSTFVVVLEPLSTIVAIARARRPELAAARARVAAAGSGRSVEQTRILRELTAMVGTKNMAGERSLMAGISAPLPLFDQNRGEIQRASAEQRAVRHELEWADRRLLAEVSGAYEAARRLTEQVAPLERSFIRRAEEARRIALGAYREGATSILQVLDAARALGDARLTYYELLFAQHQSVLELRAAVGVDILEERLSGDQR